MKRHKKKQDKEHETGSFQSAATNYASTKTKTKTNFSLSYRRKKNALYNISRVTCSFFFLDASADSRFEISRKGVYDPYVLSIVNLISTDDGDYYCCLASNCSSNMEGICENIRLFVIGKSSFFRIHRTLIP